ncbi:uncharacterized protein BP5553_07477 [Venustampulla echinocandica]|uniref:Nudix hydrolase domain-containing protein n=1 Tax=Venustampulla echinocandica TaxID=2656787 RepID=A0A370TGM3_9HELO|nr:uncharacterized protein BP5553_07477 [Venustampulla echinocandica]RDL34349.1 hypothetical protein BP5553_07477 [Venustampulla echinocandica]
MDVDANSFDLPGFTPPVPVRLTKDITKEQLLGFPAFKTWAKTIKSSLALQYTEAEHPFKNDPYTLWSVTVQSVDYFGGTRIGFVKMSADVRNKEGYLPGIAFLRGGSVGMLMILRPSDYKNERWVVMTEQARIPAGSLRFMEIPAGMMDKHGTFAGAAAIEIKEETGIEVKEDDLVNLTELALAEAGVSEPLQQAMYPSPGGSDEYIAIFLWEKVLDRQEIEDLRDKLTGLRSRGERITIRLLDYEELWKVGARDAKTLAAWSLYEALRRARHNKLPNERIY